MRSSTVQIITIIFCIAGHKLYNRLTAAMFIYSYNIWHPIQSAFLAVTITILFYNYYYNTKNCVIIVLCFEHLQHEARPMFGKHIGSKTYMFGKLIRKLFVVVSSKSATKQNRNVIGSQQNH